MTHLMKFSLFKASFGICHCTTTFPAMQVRGHDGRLPDDGDITCPHEISSRLRNVNYHPNILCPDTCYILPSHIFVIVKTLPTTRERTEVRMLVRIRYKVEKGIIGTFI